MNLIDKDELIEWINRDIIDHHRMIKTIERDCPNSDSILVEKWGIEAMRHILGHITYIRPENPQEDKSDKRCGTCENFPNKVDNTIHCKKGWVWYNPQYSSQTPVYKTDGLNCPHWKAKEPEKPKENWIEIEVSIYNKDKHGRKENRFFMCRNCDANIYVKRGVVVCYKCKTKYKIEEDHILNSESCFSGHVEIESKEKRRVWECSMCGKHLEYDDKRMYYFHCGNQNIFCQPPNIAVPIKLATPKPDSERWVEV